jgi:hypothetical protein
MFKLAGRGAYFALAYITLLPMKKMSKPNNIYLGITA